MNNAWITPNTSSRNTVSVAWIKDEAERIFSLVRQSLEHYAANHHDTALIKTCHDQIHQINGVMEMFGLNTVAVVGHEMETLIDLLHRQELKPETRILDTLRQAGKTAADYLATLTDDTPDNLLYLFPTYQNLLEARGVQHVSEKNLLLSDLSLRLPSPAGPASDAHRTPSDLARMSRPRFQSALLKWLHSPVDQTSLRQMHDIIKQIEESILSSEKKIFWQISREFLDSLLHQGISIDLPVKKLCAKIEQAISHLADPRHQAIVADDQLMDAMLSLVADSNPVSKYVEEISHTWDQIRQLTASHQDILSPAGSKEMACLVDNESIPKSVLEEIRCTLTEAKEAWSAYTSNTHHELTRFIACTTKLRQTTPPVWPSALQKLIPVIGGTAAHLRIQPQVMSAQLALEVAASLLLLENGLEQDLRLSPGIAQQAEILVSRLRSLVRYKTETVSTSNATFVSNETRSGKLHNKALGEQISRESLVNLRQAEQILDEFFRNPANRTGLPVLPALLKQVSGVLVMLGAKQTNELLDACRSLVARFLHPGYEIKRSEQIRLAEGLSSIGFFLAACKDEYAGHNHLIQHATALFINSNTIIPIRTVPADHAEIAQKPMFASAQHSHHPTLDQELLHIFLEESRTALVSIEHHVLACRKNPLDRNLLIAIRRSFHTLKGSSAMIRLTEISQAANSVEKVINRWLGKDKSVSADLLDLIIYAHQEFNQWCHDLETQGSAQVEISGLLALARVLTDQDSKVKVAVTPSPKQYMASLQTSVPSDTPLDVDPSPPLPPQNGVVCLETRRNSKTSPSGERRIIRDVIDKELLEVFLDETTELLPEISSELRAWKTDRESHHLREALLRSLHTLKGNARIGGAIRLGELIHNMESRIENATDPSALSPLLFEELEAGFDRVSEDIERLQKSLHGISATRNAREIAELLSDNTPVTPPPWLNQPVTSGLLPHPASSSGSGPHKPLLRVHTSTIDHLIDTSTAIRATQTRLESEIHGISLLLTDLNTAIGELEKQLSRTDTPSETLLYPHQILSDTPGISSGSPLHDELARFHALQRQATESTRHLSSICEHLSDTSGAAQGLLSHQALLNHDLHHSLMQVRTVTFDSFIEHLYRVVRQTARDLKKKTSLTVHGGDIELDRYLLERINPSLEHLLRNAVAHGIETPTERLASGKPETGQITLSLRQNGNELVITLSDDGQGLDIGRIREKALQLNLINEDAYPDDQQIMSLIFSHGLSTAREITEIFGRGVGLDVVKMTVNALGGHVNVNSISGTGTTFTISLPLSLKLLGTTMVQAAGQTYAIPSSLIEHIREIDADTADTARQLGSIEYNQCTYPFASLAGLLGNPDDTPTSGKSHIILLHQNTSRLAIHIDKLIGNHETAIKNTSTQLTQVLGMEGATILNDGQVILIINPLTLHRPTGNNCKPAAE